MSHALEKIVATQMVIKEQVLTLHDIGTRRILPPSQNLIIDQMSNTVRKRLMIRGTQTMKILDGKRTKNNGEVTSVESLHMDGREKNSQAIIT